jgi:hypothetical protein
MEEGYELAKRPTRHTGDVPAPDPHAVKGNPHGVNPNKSFKATKQLIFGVLFCIDSALLTLPF